MNSIAARPLPWSLAYDRPDDAPPPFHDAFAAALATVTSETRGSFAMIPNFRFNHTRFRPKRVEDLLLGRLVASLDTDKHRIVVTQEDTTSGERWTLTLDGLERPVSARTTWQVEASFDRTTTVFDGWIEESDVERRAFCRLHQTSRLQARAPLDRPLIHRPTLFLGLREFSGVRFDLLDGSHGHEGSLQLRQVDEVSLAVGGRQTPLHCFALFGGNSSPSYWWVDADDRVVAMAGTLWTYVLINPDRTS